MKRNLTITCLFFQTVIVSILFATAFVTKPAFFQHLIAAKQWGVELVMLIVIFFLVLYIPFVKKSKAESAYIQNSYMVSSLLLPKYLLTKLYKDSAQHNKAKQTARKILNSPVKIESSATRDIMHEMKNIITQSGTTCPDN
jgi:hypothetical protein